MLWILHLFFISAFASEATAKSINLGVPYKYNRNQALVEYHDLIISAYSDIGYKVNIVLRTAQSPREILLSGKVDAVAYDDLSDTREVEKVVITSFPVAKTFAMVFYLKSAPVTTKTLKKYKGTISLNNARILKEAARRHLNFVQATNPFHCMQLLLEKKVHYCISVREVGLSTIKANPEAKGKVEMMEEPFVETPVHLAMRREFKDIMPKLEEALKKRLTGDLSPYPTVRGALNTNP
ncbi:substrate-binding periplasmic protein [Bdellovibrio sp. HCB274]|uniref:substrate-binding periplasmic protein n=1 Tax=Bdellovibrio sp. HCB274 TaxID=3394361 RepID=UPI0039B6E6FE